jgi:hypothetical protein
MKNEVMMAYRGSVCLILFHNPGFGLDEAFRTLSACTDLGVTREEDSLGRLAVQKPGCSVLRISHQSGTATQRWVAGLDRQTQNTHALGQCDACFFIHIDDLRTTLKDISSLTLVQRKLLEATQGLQYTLWDDRLRVWRTSHDCG